MSGVRGHDNLYNENINQIALLNYNKGIANKLRMQEQQMERYLPFKEPKLLGGVRYSDSIVAGTSPEGPATLAVGGRAFRRFTGEETPAQGGKVNHLKKAKKWLDFSKDVVSDAFGIYDKIKERGAGMNEYDGKGSMVYSQSLKNALKKGGACGGLKKPCNVGGARKTARFVKGSQEAKDHMARIRAMKK